MRVLVLGLAHLGSVTAACLAHLGHSVIGFDVDAAAVADLSKGVAPVLEAGLNTLLQQGLSAGNLRFSSNFDDVRGVEIVWVSLDTPIDEDDIADIQGVMSKIERVMHHMDESAALVISSQLPVGTVGRLRQYAAAHFPGRRTAISYSPENLRLGTAVNDFLHPSRIVVGVASSADKPLLELLLSTITTSIEWMSVESAEMTKHAINAFFAASIAFANEIAVICEAVGADAKEVERGLKTEPRIGAGARLSPGGAFGGGTLARDVRYLCAVADARELAAPLLSAVLPSNDSHKLWAQRKIESLFPDLSDTTIAIWGLAYKPHTDSLRRSGAIALGDWLIRRGAAVRVHDPAVSRLPPHWQGVIRCDEPLEAIRGAHALVVATAWPMYANISAGQLSAVAPHLAVLDAARVLSSLAAARTTPGYFYVGMPIEGSAK